MLTVHFLLIPTCNAVELNDDEERRDIWYDLVSKHNFS